MEAPAPVTNYSQYLQLLRRKWLPATCAALALVSLNTLNVLKKPDIYRASGLLVYKSQDQAEQLIGLEQVTGQASQKEKVLGREIAVLKTSPTMKEVLERLPKSQSEGLSTQTLSKHLSITIEKGTDVVRLSFENEDPKLASDVINHLMDIFLQRNIRENRASTIAAGQFIANQLPVVRRKVLAASYALQTFQEENGLFSLESDVSTSNEILLTGQQSLSELEAQLSGVEQQIRDLRQQLNVTSTDQILESTDLSQSGEITGAIDSYLKLDEELDLARSTLTLNHPTVIDLESQHQQLSQRLLALGVNPKSLGDQRLEGPQIGESRQALSDQLIQLELNQQGLIAQRQGLRQQQQSIKARVLSLPELQNQYRELRRELEAAEFTYDSLLKRLQEIRVTENQTIPNVEIIEPALTPGFPVLPNRSSEILRGLIASLLLGYVVAYTLDRLDRRIRTADDVRRVYPFPVLGTIPLLDKDGDHDMNFLPVRDRPNSSLAESYRMLQANLKFLQSDHALKAIAISSAIMGEGKSTTAANVALALAESHRVLLLDADLRRPSQHQIWEIANRFGLSNLLSETEREFSSLKVEEWKISDQLYVFPSGVVPPNPVTLLESKRMAQFLAWCREKFDYVVIDLPPVTVAADALFISKISDGLLLVGRPEKLNRTAASHCLDTLQQTQINLLGLVINGMIIKNEPNSYYYQRSYYHNSYYSEENQKSRSNLTSSIKSGQEEQSKKTILSKVK